MPHVADLFVTFPVPRRLWLWHFPWGEFMHIEGLEARQLMAAVFYDPDISVITIRGTQQADHISVIRRGDRILVQLNDLRRWFAYSRPLSIQIEGRGGDDSIDTTYTPFNVQAFGGPGNDTIIGGYGKDIFYGGDGADRLIGNAGDDDLRGGGGRDRLIGVGGNDSLQGDGGDDQMSGGNGDDYFISGVGLDLIDGGNGADVADRYADRGDVRSIEGETFYSPVPSDDPYTHASVVYGGDGVSVLVTSTHFQGGYLRHFGDFASREGDTFTVSVVGEDLDPAGTNARDQALHTERHTYALGKLADGTYTFNAQSDTHRLATLTIQVAGGKAVGTPTWAGPWAMDGVLFPFHSTQPRVE
jgi:Ca2+-binding RTX toxin-like protein